MHVYDHSAIPWVDGSTRLFVGAIESVGAAILVIGVFASLVHLILATARGELGAKIVEARLTLGQRLVLALEFLIAADILKTVVAPSLEELALLGGTILIRTVLSLSIAYELKGMGGAKA
ncbi:DUF1622 domain-containing protein [Candidatus Sumerlaeota bacterium]|nr:DUF1622 domain-containing protein [Candidatus Sumerlaeota bacterium]